MFKSLRIKFKKHIRKKKKIQNNSILINISIKFLKFIKAISIKNKKIKFINKITELNIFLNYIFKLLLYLRIFINVNNFFFLGFFNEGYFLI